MANAIDYTKVNWKDFPNTETPVNAANLNRMDKGIDDLNAVATALQTTTADHQTRILQLESYKTSSSTEITNIKSTYTTKTYVDEEIEYLLNRIGQVDYDLSDDILDLKNDMREAKLNIDLLKSDIDVLKRAARAHGWNV